MNGTFTDKVVRFLNNAKQTVEKALIKGQEIVTDIRIEKLSKLSKNNRKYRRHSSDSDCNLRSFRFIGGTKIKRTRRRSVKCTTKRCFRRRSR